MMMGCFYRCVKQITVGISICKSRKNDVDFNAAVKRADINMNSESLNEKLGDWGYKKQQKKISGRNQYVIHGMRLVVERPEY